MGVLCLLLVAVLDWCDVGHFDGCHLDCVCGVNYFNCLVSGFGVSRLRWRGVC